MMSNDEGLKPEDFEDAPGDEDVVGDGVEDVLPPGVEMREDGRYAVHWSAHGAPRLASWIATKIVLMQGSTLGGGLGIYTLGETLALVRRHADGRVVQDVIEGREELRSLLSEHVLAHRFDRRANEWQDCAAQADLLSLVFAQLQVCAPRLEGVFDHPVLDLDGQLMTTGGYDPRRGLLIMSEAVEVENVEDPHEALALLEDWLKEFPFVSRGDRLRALSWAMSILMRLFLHDQSGPPGGLFRALNPNAGKSLLVRSLVAAITGRVIRMVGWPKGTDADALEKLLLSALRLSPAVIGIDNIPRGWDVRNEHIERFITEAHFAGRLLRTNTNVAPSCSVPLAISGNALSASGDTHSRFLPINLDRPVGADGGLEGAFEREDIIAWTLDNRPRLLGAMICVLRHGLAMPAGDPIPRWNRFPAWTRRVARPIMDLSGDWGFLDHWKKLFGDDLPPRLITLQALVEEMIALGPEKLRELCEGHEAGSPIWTAADLDRLHYTTMRELMNLKRDESVPMRLYFQKLRWADGEVVAGVRVRIARANLGDRSHRKETNGFVLEALSPSSSSFDTSDAPAPETKGPNVRQMREGLQRARHNRPKGNPPE